MKLVPCEKKILRGKKWFVVLVCLFVCAACCSAVRGEILLLSRLWGALTVVPTVLV